MAPQLEQLEVGMEYSGGIVVQDIKVLQSGLLITSHDLGTAVNWETANRLCKECTDGGHSDWRLPSAAELQLAYSNLYTADLGEFAAANYWSSTPGYGPSVFRTQVFKKSDRSLLEPRGWPRGEYFHVRAVRYLPSRVPSISNLIQIPSLFFASNEIASLAFDRIHFVGVDNAGNLLANAKKGNAAAIKTEVYKDRMLLHIGGNYVKAGTDGLLRANTTSANEATAFTFWVATDFNIVIKTNDGRYWNSSDGESVKVEGRSTYGMSMQFQLYMKFESQGRHFQTQAISMPSPCEKAELNMLWQVTGGLFLAIGIGPYLVNPSQSSIEPGIMALLSTNRRVREAKDVFLLAIIQNKGKLGLGLASAAAIYIKELHASGQLMEIAKLLIKKGGPALIGPAIQKILTMTILPDAEMAALFVSLTQWYAGFVSAGNTIVAECSGNVLHEIDRGNRANYGTIEIYQAAAFKGNHRQIEERCTNLGKGWNDTVRSFNVTSGTWIFYEHKDYGGRIWGPFRPQQYGGPGTGTQFDTRLVETTSMRGVYDDGITLFREPNFKGEMIHLNGSQIFDLTDEDINFTAIHGSLIITSGNWELTMNAPLVGPKAEYSVRLRVNGHYRDLAKGILIVDGANKLLKLRRGQF